MESITGIQNSLKENDFGVQDTMSFGLVRFHYY
jgi:hypothetical protein